MLGAVLAAALLPLLGAGFYMAAAAKDAVVKETFARLQIQNRAISDAVDFFIVKNTVLVQTFLAANAVPPLKSEARLHDELSAFVDAMPGVSGLALINTTGEETAYFGARPRFDYSDILPQIIATSVKARGNYIGTLRRNPNRRQLLLNMSFPLGDGMAGPGPGAAVGEFNLQEMTDSFAPYFGAGGAMLVFTKNGFLIYSSKEGLAVNIDDAYKNKITPLTARAANDNLGDFNGRGIAARLSVNPATDWLIYSETPVPSAFGMTAIFLKDNLKIFIMLTGAVLAFTLALAFYLYSMIARPVEIMTKAVIMAEQGDISNLPALPAPDNEIGALAMAFARMLDSIKMKMDELAQDRHDLEEINQSLEIRVGSRTKELRVALSEMIKKERLAAIGQMASIVSHEIRNPLAVMANALYLIKARVGEEADPKLLKNIAVIEQEIKQANGIIEEILGYARSRDQIFSVVDLNLYMKEIMASYPIPNNIVVTAEYSDIRLPVRIDAEEIKQAVRNIIGNSLEVMPTGGKLLIKTKLEGAGARMSIRDSGPGIPKDIQEKIFNPFFTTKARGTGLGLAVVKKAAARNNADIILRSEEGKGTKISMIFKLYKETP